MADVTRPIIGADFGILIYVKRNRLVDPQDRSSVETVSVDSVDKPFFASLRSLQWTKLLGRFPEVTRESPVPSKFKHDVVHELHT